MQYYWLHLPASHPILYISSSIMIIHSEPNYVHVDQPHVAERNMTSELIALVCEFT